MLVIALAVSPLAMADEADEMAQLGKMEQFLSVMQGYYELIEVIHGVSSDPDKSAILQLQKIEEFYKQRGDRAEAIAYMRKIVDTTNSPVVRNAASMMLSEALNETGRATQAVEVLKAALEKNLK
jgi:tetratricopeptide (TPR) repeat protein